MRRHRLKVTTVLLISCAIGYAQDQPLLKIISPENDTIVNPGQTIRVQVVSSGGVVKNVAVLGEHLEATEIVQQLPATFSVTIPSDMDCRRYALRAMGANPAKSALESDSIDLIVERPDMPVSLYSQFETLYMQSRGETAPMMLSATFSDHRSVVVTECPLVTYRSTNTAVATVDNFSTTTAVGTGSASIMVAYKNPHGPDLRLSIPVTVMPPAITFSPSSPAFGDVMVGAGADLTVTVRNVTVSDSGLMFKEIAVQGDYAEKDNCISSSPLGVGETCTIQLTFTPKAAGPRSGTLSVITTASGPDLIPLSGTGLAPASK